MQGDSAHNACRYLVLKAEYIVNWTIEPVRPQMHAGCGIDQLGRNTHPVCTLRTLPSST